MLPFDPRPNFPVLGRITYTHELPADRRPPSRYGAPVPARIGRIRLANVKTLKLAAGEQAIYIGRGRAPSGMEHAHLGNPFRVGDGYAQGEAAAAYLEHLRRQVRAHGPERATILRLAQRLADGDRLVICCWCDPSPCHGEHVLAVVEGYARRLGWTGH